MEGDRRWRGVIEQGRRVLPGISNLFGGTEGRTFKKFTTTIPYWQGRKNLRFKMLLLYVRGFSCRGKDFLILQMRKRRFPVDEFFVRSHTKLNK